MTAERVPGLLRLRLRAGHRRWEVARHELHDPEGNLNTVLAARLGEESGGSPSSFE
jgi:hypothetical protein